MIGSALKKLAKENGMTIAHGVAYGNFRGYAVTFSEGSGYKLMVITTHFADTAKINDLEAMLNSHNLMKEFRIQNLGLAGDAIAVNFLDNPGTMKKFNAFIDWFFPILPQYSAAGINTCSECGNALMGQGKWKLINGMAYYIHEACAESIQREAAEEELEMKMEDTGSYAKGFIGALLGALIGAIPWAIVLYLGYFASIIGFVIGWLANKGYELFHGKRGKGKIVILIIVSIIGVIVGNMSIDVITLMQMISGGELPGMTYGDIIPMIIYMLQVDSEYLIATLSNLGMGMLFAFLGIGTILIGAHRETKSFKMKNLD